LVEPERLLHPYDLALGDLPVAQRRAWGQRVVDGLEARFGSLAGATFEVHAGMAYRDAIEARLASRHAHAVALLARLPLGSQLRWYAGHVTLSFGRHSSANFRYRYDEHVWGRAIEELYIERRLPLREVAKRCGVDIGTIVRRMDHLAIPRRTAGESHRGRKRKPYRSKIAPCAGCGGGVRAADEDYCVTCRRRGRDRAATPPAQVG
jgi:hypothetical protein